MSQNKTIAKLQEMKQSKKGFTLVELLIVVAIIAVLVAIAVPTFMGSVSKANEQTDAANERAAKATASQTWLTNKETTAKIYYFDAASGTCVTTVPAAKSGYSKSKDPADQVVYCKVSADGQVTTGWTPAGTAVSS